MSLKQLLAMTRDFLDLRSCIEVNRFIDGVDWKLNQRNLPPADRPVTQFLGECMDYAGKSERGLVKAVIEMAPVFSWFTSYKDADFDGHVVSKLASVELAGPRGHFMSEETRFGFFLQGSYLEYPNHRHQAEELYIPLTSGTLWSRDNADFVARQSGEIIVHTSNEQHSMTTRNAPLLALWIWRGGDFRQRPEY
jgi:hypothetical protein